MKIVFVAVAIFCAVWAGLYFFIPCEFDIVKLYQDKMQTALFTGFLTIGGFLLTLKTFILIKLKEGIYDLDKYKQRIELKRQLNSTLTLYGPLKRLGIFLVYGVASSIVTALSQLTIGFIPSRIASTFCMSLGVLTGLIVIISWWLIKENLNDWFSLLEEEK